MKDDWNGSLRIRKRAEQGASNSVGCCSGRWGASRHHRMAKDALLLLFLCVLLASSHARHFRYGDISWATCRNIEAPHAVFYDPLFPDVCRNCASGLCIGVTVQVAFQVQGFEGLGLRV